MGGCAQPLHVSQVYRVLATSHLPCFHHKRSQAKHTFIRSIQQVLASISTLWEGVKVIDMYFQD